MKICVIGPAYPHKGGIAHYNNWLCHFVSKKHDLKCISFKRLYPRIAYPGKEQRDPSATNRTKFNSIEILDSINPLSWKSAFKEIKEYNPDFVLFYWWTPYFTFLDKFLTHKIKRNLKSKIIFLCHNVIPHKQSSLDKILSKIALKKGDYFIVHASKEKQDLQKILPNISSNSIIKTTHPSYDVQFRYKEISKEEAKKKINITGKVILFFGYIRDYKGLMYLINAMPNILKRMELTLLIVGEVWEGNDKYHQQVKKLGIENNVRIIDNYVPDDNVCYYYSACDLVVLPYLTATNSGIVQIAFGFEKPVIITNVGGLPEVVSHEKTGLVIPPKDSKSIEEAVIRFYKENLGEKFKENIIKEKERFSWERMVEVIENLGEKE
jgi:glycosyltransferase involved in cell wall biosynthesis